MPCHNPTYRSKELDRSLLADESLFRLRMQADRLSRMDPDSSSYQHYLVAISDCPSVMRLHQNHRKRYANSSLVRRHLYVTD